MADPTVRAELVLQMAEEILKESRAVAAAVDRLGSSIAALLGAAELAVRLDYHAGAAEEEPADDLPVPVPGSAAPD